MEGMNIFKAFNAVTQMEMIEILWPIEKYVYRQKQAVILFCFQPVFLC